ncbi:MAG: hypothetical protein CM15mP39_04020 [Synechococcus sp.]|nr:MAG: hypothetical protein CM15mP39_04020 [Synechococcus sp.]
MHVNYRYLAMEALPTFSLHDVLLILTLIVI